MRSEFEEKEYESLLYHELEQNCERVWSPGQCLENYIGFDRAEYIKDLEVWRKLGYSFCGGRSLAEHELEKLWSSLGVKREMPDFKFNLFIQAKRSYSVVRLPSSLKYLRIYNMQWYKFLVDKHQQLILEELSDEFNGMALVIYAAPIFDTIKDLYTYEINNTIVDNSVFCEARKLHNHKELLYNKNEQIACSKPEEMPRRSVLNYIDNFLEEVVHREDYREGTHIINGYSIKNDNESDNMNNLHFVSNNILRAITKNDAIISSLCHKFIYEVNTIKRSTKYYDLREKEKQILTDYLIINRFCEFFNIQWYVLGE